MNVWHNREPLYPDRVNPGSLYSPEHLVLLPIATLRLSQRFRRRVPRNSFPEFNLERIDFSGVAGVRVELTKTSL
jgi:hypothetical protein